MIKFSQPVLNYAKFSKIIKKPITNNFPNEGSLSSKLSKKLSKILKIKYATNTTSGTASLFLALKALGIKKGDEVIVPNFTYQATANAVHNTGAKVILTDINTENLLIDLKKLLKNINRKTKAIIAVHVSGRGSNIYKLKKIAKEKKIFLIEDAAEALFSKYKNKYLGTIGDIGCFSYAPNKILTTGQGGLIVTKNKNLYKKILKFKDHGKIYDDKKDQINFDLRGFNLKFTDIQAALGLSQINDYKNRIHHLKKVHRYYIDNLKDIDEIKFIKFEMRNGELPLWTDIICENRQKLFNFLKKKGIYARLFWMPLNKTKAFKNLKKNLISSDSIHKKLLWLPSSLILTNSNLSKIVKNIKFFYKNNNEKI